MSFTSRVKSFFGGAEGSWRGPFSGQGELGGWYDLGRYEDGFQRNLSLDKFTMERIPAIAGGKHLYRSAFAQLRGDHQRFGPNGSVEKVISSAASRILITPNGYETASDFNSRLVDEWITHGEVVCLATRNDRFEVSSLHIMPRASWQIYVDPESKEHFYFFGDDGDHILTPTNAQMAVSPRDILHLKWATDRRNPLIGVSPLQAAGAAAGIHTELTASQMAFFHNMSRPSGILATDMKLTAQQMKELRAAFENQSKGMSAGNIPILGSGMKWQPLGVTSQDAEVINALKLSNDEIFRALGIPPPLMGALEHATLSNVEQLVSAWLSFSLGGLIEKYERGLDRLFGFDSRTNRVEMDVSILLRSDILARTEAHSKMIVSGIATPNEIRRKEGMGSIDGGDNLFLQRQMTPVNLITELNTAELERAKNPPEPAPVAEPAPVDDETAKALALHAIRKAMSA